MHDSQLLDDYVTRNSETAFQSLVSRYLNLVHSTALRQVGNAPLAEEVAQAVFILLARKASRLRNTQNLVLGGWLYRTTRFVAARAQRGELRRRRREQEALQMQQLSSADETWRRIAPLLDEGIEQLDQTDRDAVIVRFFQDEPLSVVGGALGISEEAARKRVSRSLEKLRTFFARRGFTISVAALATALAGHPAQAAPAALAGAIGAKSLAHAACSAATLPVLVAETLRAWWWAKVRILAGLAAAATLAASALLLVANTGTSPSGPPALSSPVQSVPSATPAAKQSAAPAESQARNAWRLAFQAVDAETGKGIANARILVESVGDMKQVLASPQQIDRQTNLRADALGRCDITLPYANPLMVSVGVLAEGYAETSVVGGGPKPLPDSYVLRLPRGSSIGGVVQDESGQPVAGAGIQVSCYGTGDASGREFQRERPGLLNEDNVATTDSAGRWVFRSAPTNGDFQLIVTHPAFPKANFHNDDDSRTSREAGTLKLDDLHAGAAVLILKAGLTLRGVVTDEKGRQVAGAKVSHGRFFPEGNGVATDGDGSFALPALPAGENTITITAERFAPQRIQVRMASNTVPLAVQLKRGAVLRLRVLDEAGSPVPDARVGLEQWQGPNTLEWGGLTDWAGCLEWNSAPLEPISFSVLKDGYFTSRRNTLIADGQEHTITLRPQLTVVGRVTDAQTKQPVATFKAVPDPNRNETAYGTNGQFKLTFTEFSQPLVVRIEADGYESATSQPLDGGATNITCDFELKRNMPEDAIEGVVLLPDGSAASGAQVALCGEHAVEMGKARFMNRDSSATTQTDAEGHFSFKAGLAARAVAAVAQQGFAMVSVTPTNHSVSIQLQPWGRIEGTLRLMTQPNSGQPILLSAPPSPGLEETLSLSLGAYTTKTDEGGNFVFEQAPPGQFDLYVAKLNVPYHHKTPVQIQPGATTVVQIGGAGDVLSGRLVFSGPGQAIDWSRRLLIPMLQTKLPCPPGLTGLAQAQWYANYSKTEEGRARIRAVCSYPLDVRTDGTFTVEGVPPGDYELSGQLSDSAVDLSRGVLGHTIGSFKQDVTVPQTAGRHSTGAIDLGTIPVQGPNR
ncbi:MAG: sigma-70 family RNA polymerase sigma factor [Limisphaerales bacterium]